MRLTVRWKGALVVSSLQAPRSTLNVRGRAWEGGSEGEWVNVSSVSSVSSVCLSTRQWGSNMVADRCPVSIQAFSDWATDESIIVQRPRSSPGGPIMPGRRPSIEVPATGASTLKSACPLGKPPSLFPGCLVPTQSMRSCWTWRTRPSLVLSLESSKRGPPCGSRRNLRPDRSQ